MRRAAWPGCSGSGTRRWEAIRFRLTGPSRTGAPALHVARDAGGQFERILVNSVGPVELWAAQHGAARCRVAEPRTGADRRGCGTGSARGDVSVGLRQGTVSRRRSGRWKAGAWKASVEEAEILDALADETVRATAQAAGVGGDERCGCDSSEGKRPWDRLKSTNCAGRWRRRSFQAPVPSPEPGDAICRECGRRDRNACVDIRDGPCRGGVRGRPGLGLRGADAGEGGPRIFGPLHGGRTVRRLTASAGALALLLAASPAAAVSRAGRPTAIRRSRRRSRSRPVPGCGA